MIADGLLGRKCAAHPREDSSLRQLWRLMNVLFKVRKGGLSLEMLEMKEPPGMCMKTNATRQNVTLKTRLFARKCTHCAIIDKNRADWMAELHELRDESRKGGADL
jgi:hypothetical protein